MFLCICISKNSKSVQINYILHAKGRKSNSVSTRPPKVTIDTALKSSRSAYRNGQVLYCDVSALQSGHVTVFRICSCYCLCLLWICSFYLSCSHIGLGLEYINIKVRTVHIVNVFLFLGVISIQEIEI